MDVMRLYLNCDQEIWTMLRKMNLQKIAKDMSFSTNSTNYKFLQIVSKFNATMNSISCLNDFADFEIVTCLILGQTCKLS